MTGMNLEGIRLNETSQSQNDIAPWEPRKIRITPSYPLAKLDTLWFSLKEWVLVAEIKGIAAVALLHQAFGTTFPTLEDSKPRVLGPAHAPKVLEARAVAPPPLPGVRRLRGRHVLRTSSLLPAT